MKKKAEAMAKKAETNNSSQAKAVVVKQIEVNPMNAKFNEFEAQLVAN